MCLECEREKNQNIQNYKVDQFDLWPAQTHTTHTENQNKRKEKNDFVHE